MNAMPYALPAGDEFHVGVFVKTTSPQCVEILGTTALDFAVLDAEHAPFDRAALDLAMMAGRAARLPLLVRVPDREAASLLSVLDMGAAGVLVPHVDSAEQAREVAAHCRYVNGDRGYSSSPRAAGYGTLRMKDAIRHGDDCRVLCQIESVQAVEQAERIAAVPGVDALFIGRADLALSMGLDDAQHERVGQATEHVIRAGNATGKRVGMFVGSTAEREKYRSLGVCWFVQGSDQSLLRQGAQAIARSDSTRVLQA
jgi:2-keto-3-deoxy-L-rhamnonate aldolase RhmA